MEFNKLKYYCDARIVIAVNPYQSTLLPMLKIIPAISNTNYSLVNIIVSMHVARAETSFPELNLIGCLAHDCLNLPHALLRYRLGDGRDSVIKFVFEFLLLLLKVEHLVVHYPPVLLSD